MAFDKASKTSGLMKQISILDDKVSSLMAKIVYHKEYDSFAIGIIESAYEMLRCKVPCDSSFFFPFNPLLLCDILCHLRHLFGFCC
jgi:hypothetical protein